MPDPIKELPFPWPCGKCGQQAVERETLPYSTAVQYDGRSYTVEVPEFRVPRCKNCGAMVFDDPANDQITEALRRQVGLLPPERIRSNRESLGLTQRDFAGLLGVGESTVSRWETGVQIQQKSLDRLMRLFFAFPHVREALIGTNRLAELGTQVVERQEPRLEGPAGPDPIAIFQESMCRYRDHAAHAGETDAVEAYLRKIFDVERHAGSNQGESRRRRWLVAVAPLWDASRGDLEQADRLSELATRLDALAEGKRESILVEFQRLAEIMTD